MGRREAVLSYNKRSGDSVAMWCVWEFQHFVGRVKHDELVSRVSGNVGVRFLTLLEVIVAECQCAEIVR
jgi:hypothetical protein